MLNTWLQGVKGNREPVWVLALPPASWVALDSSLSLLQAWICHVKWGDGNILHSAVALPPDGHTLPYLHCFSRVSAKITQRSPGSPLLINGKKTVFIEYLPGVSIHWFRHCSFVFPLKPLSSPWCGHCHYWFTDKETGQESLHDLPKVTLRMAESILLPKGACVSMCTGSLVPLGDLTTLEKMGIFLL